MRLCISMAAAACALAAAGETVLWPSAETEMRAQTDSRIAMLPDGSVDVKTGAKTSWPGVRMDFKKGECDLSKFGRIVICVSNTTDKTRTVNLSVKGRTNQGQSPGGSVTLLPHATGKIVSYLRNMPWTLVGTGVVLAIMLQLFL